MKILIISFTSGTYGNYLSQSLVRLNSSLFKLKNIQTSVPKITKTGYRYYHNSTPFFADLFYFGKSKFPFVTASSDLELIKYEIQSHPDNLLLDNKKHNIVLTHMYNDDSLLTLKSMFGDETKVIKIIYQFDSIDSIANRFYDISQHLTANKPIDLALYKQHLVQCYCETSKFNVIDYEKIFDDEYLEYQINNLK